MKPISELNFSLSNSNLKFVDGWELNGEYFPGVHDHELSLENRVEEFCDKSFAFKRKASLKRKFTSRQNAAVFQYKIPIQGAFAISVRYLHNPKRELGEKILIFRDWNFNFEHFLVDSLQYYGGWRRSLLRSSELRLEHQLHVDGIISGCNRYRRHRGGRQQSRCHLWCEKSFYFIFCSTFIISRINLSLSQVRPTECFGQSHRRRISWSRFSSPHQRDDSLRQDRCQGTGTGDFLRCDFRATRL